MLLLLIFILLEKEKPFRIIIKKCRHPSNHLEDIFHGLDPFNIQLRQITNVLPTQKKSPFESFDTICH